MEWSHVIPKEPEYSEGQLSQLSQWERYLLTRNPIIAPDGYIPNSVVRRRIRFSKPESPPLPWQLKPVPQSDPRHLPEGWKSKKDLDRGAVFKDEGETVQVSRSMLTGSKGGKVNPLALKNKQYNEVENRTQIFDDTLQTKHPRIVDFPEENFLGSVAENVSSPQELTSQEVTSWDYNGQEPLPEVKENDVIETSDVSELPDQRSSSRQGKKKRRKTEKKTKKQKHGIHTAVHDVILEESSETTGNPEELTLLQRIVREKWFPPNVQPVLEPVTVELISLLGESTSSVFASVCDYIVQLHGAFNLKPEHMEQITGMLLTKLNSGDLDIRLKAEDTLSKLGLPRPHDSTANQNKTSKQGEATKHTGNDNAGTTPQRVISPQQANKENIPSSVKGSEGTNPLGTDGEKERLGLSVSSVNLPQGSAVNLSPGSELETKEQVEGTIESHDAGDSRATSVTPSHSSHLRGAKHGGKEGKKKRKSSSKHKSSRLSSASKGRDSHNQQDSHKQMPVTDASGSQESQGHEQNDAVDASLTENLAPRGSLTSVQDDQKSANGDQNSVRGDQKSVQSNQKSVVSDQKSVGDHQKSVYKNEKSAHLDEKSVHLDEKSTHRDEKLLYSEQSPSATKDAIKAAGETDQDHDLSETLELPESKVVTHVVRLPRISHLDSSDDYLQGVTLEESDRLSQLKSESGYTSINRDIHFQAVESLSADDISLSKDFFVDVSTFAMNGSHTSLKGGSHTSIKGSHASLRGSHTSLKGSYTSIEAGSHILSPALVISKEEEENTAGRDDVDQTSVSDQPMALSRLLSRTEEDQPLDRTHLFPPIIGRYQSELPDAADLLSFRLPDKTNLKSQGQTRDHVTVPDDGWQNLGKLPDETRAWPPHLGTHDVLVVNHQLDWEAEDTDTLPRLPLMEAGVHTNLVYTFTEDFPNIHIPTPVTITPPLVRTRETESYSFPPIKRASMLDTGSRHCEQYRWAKKKMHHYISISKYLSYTCLSHTMADLSHKVYQRRSFTY